MAVIIANFPHEAMQGKKQLCWSSSHHGDGTTKKAGSARGVVDADRGVASEREPFFYRRLNQVGYFEGIDSDPGIAWRASDSLSIRSFVRIALDESVPDHSTISQTGRLMDVETHQAVFQ
jgi:hypothetical protein